MNRAQIDIGPDDTFILFFQADESALSHSVTIPATESGLAVLKRILHARKQDTKGRKISTQSAPVQAQIRQWLAADRAARAAEARAQHTATLTSIDISLINIEELDL